jgi:hypothetical protein
VIVETHAVNDRSVGDKAKQPRLVVSWLRSCRNRADLDVAEPELTESADRCALFVEACRYSEGRVELEAERRDFERGIRSGESVDERPNPENGQRANDAICERVSTLRIEAREDDPEQESIQGQEALSFGETGAVEPWSTRNCVIAASKSSSESKPW